MALQGIPDAVIPLMGMATGVISMVLIGVTVVKVAQSQIGQALARRISGKAGVGDQELREEVLELRDHLAQVEQRLAESEERLDFTERLISSGKAEVRGP